MCVADFAYVDFWSSYHKKFIVNLIATANELQNPMIVTQQLATWITWIFTRYFFHEFVVLYVYTCESV